jgi:hypothetical protein
MVQQNKIIDYIVSYIEEIRIVCLTFFVAKEAGYIINQTKLKKIVSSNMSRIYYESYL